ncbi:MAG: CopG family antitoxin [Minisyncoccia bacterium]
MNKNKKNIYLDKEEKEIIESLENLDFKTIENDIENIEKLQKAAKEYIEKQDKTITLRISASDLNKIKAVSSKKGLRYQTFIKSIIHQYVEKEIQN